MKGVQLILDLIPYFRFVKFIFTSIPSHFYIAFIIRLLAFIIND